MKQASMVIVERMTNLREWELYRFADEETDDVVCKIAMRPAEQEREIEYGVWRREEAEPSATGNLDMAMPSGWGDEEREHALREISEIYAAELPEVAKGLMFQIDETQDDDAERDDESDEDDADEDDSDEDDADEDDSDEDDADEDDSDENDA